MDTHEKRSNGYGWRNAGSTRNGIRRSLGLPTLPIRRWSVKTYSSASDNPSDALSNSINDDSEDDLEVQSPTCDKVIDSESTNLKFVKALYVLLLVYLLVITGGFGGPYAIIFTVIIIAVAFKADQYRLAARQVSEDPQAKLAIENDIKNLLARLRSTKMIAITPEANDIGIDKTINHVVMIDTINRLREYAEDGSLVRGSQEFRDFLLMERTAYGGCNYRSWDPAKDNGDTWECPGCGMWE